MVAQPSGAAELLSTGFAGRASPVLQVVDDRIAARNVGGHLLLRTHDEATALALERHLLRLAHLAERPAMSVQARTVDSCWRDLGQRLGVHPLAADPSVAAKQIQHAARDAVMLIVGELSAACWDRDVLREITAAPGALLVIELRYGLAPKAPFGGDPELIVDGTDTGNVERWWQGIAREASARLANRSLSELELWWNLAAQQAEQLPQSHDVSLGEQARELADALHLAGRAWPIQSIATLGSPAGLQALERAGTVRCENGFVRLARSWQAPVAPELAGRVAIALETVFGSDPWARARAAGLYAQANDLEAGEHAFETALEGLRNSLARRELWDIWTAALERLDDKQRSGRSLRAAQLALRFDDVEVAVRLAQIAVSDITQPRYEALHVLGKAQLARGDVTAARGTLDRALSLTVDVSHKAATWALLAEAAYVEGDLDEAQAFADDALKHASDAVVRLEARNTAGKILLARSAWDEADEHFATDESEAGCAGLAAAKMRARVNRAIALLSKGCSDTARLMLQDVLADARQQNDVRASAFALSNLAVLATERHDYAEALSLSEQAIEARRSLGDKIGLARIITNLAELRLRLGLVDQAEQALRFGRQTLHAGMPATRVAHFALVAARIHLARNETLEAAREISTALVGARGSSDGAMLGECHRVAARIALEDGDLARAQNAISAASEHADSPYAHAELALLQALLVRARGHDASECAAEALTLARESGDEDLICESSMLLAELARSNGEMQTARQHLRTARRLRDQIAGSLPESLRASYLARRDLCRLQALEDAIARLEVLPAQESSPNRDTAACTYELTSRFVGQHPSVQRLLTAVRKVARVSAPVLVHGESGTGKEIVAEALHYLSDRRDGALVKVNCAALVETLLLSELFGHEKGAFTGASARRRGRFELADGGTLFLDEIGDISPRTQVALLRVLQDHSFERVGGSTTLRTDVRVVCATHRNLKEMVARGEFREDLYYRLSGVTLEVPPLRARRSDIRVLATALLARIAAERSEPPRVLSEGAIAALERHVWPGNVRELDNVLRAASLFTDKLEIDAQTITEHLRPASTEAVAEPVTGPCPADSSSEPSDTTTTAYHEIRNRGTSLSDLKRNVERECIRRALAEAEGNITRAAVLLGMKRPRLSQLVKQYGFLETDSEES